MACSAAMIAHVYANDAHKNPSDWTPNYCSVCRREQIGGGGGRGGVDGIEGRGRGGGWVCVKGVWHCMSTGKWLLRAFSDVFC